MANICLQYFLEFWLFFPGQNESIKLLLEHKICILAQNFMPENLSLSHSWTVTFFFFLSFLVVLIGISFAHSGLELHVQLKTTMNLHQGWMMGSDSTCGITLYSCSARDQTRGSEHKRQAWHQCGHIPSLPLPECWDSHLASYFFNKENEGSCISFCIY